MARAWREAGCARTWSAAPQSARSTARPSRRIPLRKWELGVLIFGPVSCRVQDVWSLAAVGTALIDACVGSPNGWSKRRHGAGRKASVFVGLRNREV
jgi:hypothetical protein